MQKAFINLMHQ